MSGIEELLMKFREIENDLNDGGSVDVETVENLTAPVLVRLHRERKHLADRIAEIDAAEEHVLDEIERISELRGLTR